ncbi:hypothetical protein Q7C_263 [Methylophaga frappieri]|uniref:Uncharacterized protein n=1 Tax=Methylophaga frappieri (strain ATCC BAA-2434 / DSM 25690 / JAM7) TaxID=754477 RepID=I1YEU9_METFJ|nr:hypothetical protein [Methylophaga frappieri]AFJ01442.1 hypothetical protein Q7C_263 [Methylophaga frappieri]
MKLKQLNQREKWLAGAILVVVLLGGYGYLRYDPRSTQIAALERQKNATMNRISTMEIPEEPREKIDDINAELDDLEKALDAVRENAQQVETLLAPIDSQELRVRISELARDSGIRIRVNQNLRPDPVRLGNNRRNNTSSEEIIVPPEAGWIRRLSPGSMYARPMQRLEIDGDFPSLRRFIYGLDELPYQVTVVQVNIQKLDVAPLRGMSQLLKTDLVLAL